MSTTSGSNFSNHSYTCDSFEKMKEKHGETRDILWLVTACLGLKNDEMDLWLSQAWSFQLFFSLSSKNRVIVFLKLFVTNFKPDNNLKLLVKIFSPIFSFPNDQQQPLINTWPETFCELCLKIYIPWKLCIECGLLWFVIHISTSD